MLKTNYNYLNQAYIINTH